MCKGGGRGGGRETWRIFLLTRRLRRCIKVFRKKEKYHEEIEDTLEMEEKGKDTKREDKQN